MVNNVGENIKNKRKELNMTQDTLAEKLHVTRQAVSNWENGKTQPDIETLTAISNVYECSVDELIYGIEKAITTSEQVKETAKKSITFGMCLAMVVSFTTWHSVPWAILHGLMSWIYVIYWFAKYR